MNLYQPTISGSLTVSGSVVVSGSITMSSGSISGTASLAENSLLLSGLNSGSFVGTGSYNTFSGSVSSRLVTQENASGSFAAQSASLSTRVTNLESTSSVVSSSFASTSGSIAGRVNIIETSYATTGSNNFTKPQQISDVSNAISFTSTASLYTAGGLRVSKDSFVSGTAYFNNVVVYGTSSIQYITSSQVNIGTNIITVNTDTPAVRFGGLAVFDSGSTALTGSLLWDSQNNRWIYSNPSGSTYDGGMLISGPRNTTGLGNEQGTTLNALMRGQGGDHITSSLITDDGSTLSIPYALTVTGSIVGSSSNRLGSSISDVQRMTGSVNVTGSFSVTTTATELSVGATGVILGNVLTDVHQVTGSLRVTGSGASYFLGGNVGIGTNTPDTILHVASASAAGGTSYVYFENTAPASNVGQAIQLSFGQDIGASATTPNAYIKTLNVGGSTNSAAMAFGVYTNPNTNEVMRISGSNVGIGTTNPTEKLHVAGSSVNIILNEATSGTYAINRLKNSNYNIDFGVDQFGGYIDGRAGTFRYYSGSAQYVTILNNGNVGIGSTSPGGKLVVTGSYNSPDGIISVYAGDGSWSEGIVVNPGRTDIGAVFFRNVADSISQTWFLGKTAGNFALLRNGLTGSPLFSSNAIMAVTQSNGYVSFGYNVGIGKTATSTPLDVAGSNAGSVVARIQNTSNTGYSSITFITASGTGVAHVGYGNSGVAAPLTSAAFWGSIAASPAIITTSDTERVRITSGGNVGIGTANPRGQFDVTTGQGTNGNNPIYFGRSGSASDNTMSTIISTTRQLNYGDTMIGRNLYGSPGTDAYTTAGTDSVAGYAAINFLYGGDAVFFANSGATTAGATVTPQERLRVVSNGYLRLAGAGIQFNGDTAAANALNDYEEGTWTPTIVAGGFSSISGATARYTKIGRIVHCIVDMGIVGTGDANILTFGGLPFASLAAGYSANACYFQYINTDNRNLAVISLTSSTQVTFEIVPNSTGLARGARGNDFSAGYVNLNIIYFV